MDETQRNRYMRQALRLARRGAGWVAPNPQVGCVIVKGGRLIGQGHHRRFGGPHAEIEALNDCQRRGLSPRGAVLFVNLEPCCHTGKTGPCTEAIIQAGVSEVEIATLDVFEKVAGRGAEQLRQAGVTVRVGRCETQAQRLNDGFFHWAQTGRPQVIVKWAQGLNGVLARPQTAGTADTAAPPRHVWITGQAARRHVHQVRGRCGAILVGIGTVLADDPQLTCRLAGRHYQPRRVVLDSRLRIPVKSRLAQTAGEVPVWIYTTPEAARRRQAKVGKLQQCGCEVIPLAGRRDRYELESVLKDLGGRGVTDLLVEGGGKVLSEFLRQGWADRFLVYVAPEIIATGRTAASTADKVRIEPANLTPGPLWREVRVRTLGSDILLEGYR